MNGNQKGQLLNSISIIVLGNLVVRIGENFLIEIGQVVEFAALIIVFITVLCAASILWPFIVGAPWTPTSRSTARKMLELAKVTEDDIVVDLGSGDGRIIVMAAEEFGARSIGIEVDPLRVRWSRWVIRRHGLEQKVSVIQKNFFDQSLEIATVVCLFQRQNTNNQLKTKLAGELRTGTRVVSHMYTFEGWIPAISTKNPNLYLYIM